MRGTIHRRAVDEMQVLEPLPEELITSLRELVARHIRKAILEGRLRPGEKLVQEELAKSLGISRQPVREALRRLEAEGLVVYQPRRGVFVREYTAADMQEIYMLRRLLEGHAARLAAARLEPNEWLRLEHINEQMAAAAAAADGDRFVELNHAFHHIIHAGARSPRLLELIQRVWIGDTVYGPLFLPGRAERSVSEHRRILAALRQRDAEAAAAAVCEHITNAERNFFEYRQGQPLK